MNNKTLEFKITNCWYLLAMIAVACQNRQSVLGNAYTDPMKPPSEYFPSEKAQVLVVGTFHFDYPGLDAIKTPKEDQIDVLKEPKKSEVTELVNYIERFRPTKIALEAFDDWGATEKLRAYKAGQYHDQRDERYQLGLRIAADMQLDTLYAINATPMTDILERRDSAYTTALFKDYDFKDDDPWLNKMWEWVRKEDSMVSKVRLKQYISHINSPESHAYGYGAYLVGDFKLDDYRGADVLSAWWYNRNVRIFRNIQKMTNGPQDRILVIIGNGHAAILRQLIECSPEYEFIEFDNL